MSLKEYQSSQSQQSAQQGYTEVFAWGSDSSGQMGLAGKKNGKNYPIPRFCSFNVIIDTLGCGDEHTAFIASNGYVYTMGSNADGRLGIASRNLKYSNSPCLVEALSRVKATKIACGWGHTVCVTEEGDLFSWGYGNDGQLGLGNSKSQYTPQQVQFVHPKSNKIMDICITKLDCGDHHTSVITDRGELYVFGSSDQGQLGTGRSEREQLPFKVDLYSKIRDVACGPQHTLLLTEHLKVYASGSNHQGQLGTGNKRASFVFQKVLFPSDISLRVISCGSHSGAISEDGDLYLWGTGTFGELLEPRLIPETKTKLVSLSIGGSGFGSVVDYKGIAYSWGSNKFGELGLGDYDTRFVPTPITSLQGKKVTKVACGGNFVIGLGMTILNNNGNNTNGKATATLNTEEELDMRPKSSIPTEGTQQQFQQHPAQYRHGTFGNATSVDTESINMREYQTEHKPKRGDISQDDIIVRRQEVNRSTRSVMEDVSVNYRSHNPYSQEKDDLLADFSSQPRNPLPNNTPNESQEQSQQQRYDSRPPISSKDQYNNSSSKQNLQQNNSQEGQQQQSGMKRSTSANRGLKANYNSYLEREKSQSNSQSKRRERSNSNNRNRDRSPYDDEERLYDKEDVAVNFNTEGSTGHHHHHGNHQSHSPYKQQEELNNYHSSSHSKLPPSASHSMLKDPQSTKNRRERSADKFANTSNSNLQRSQNYNEVQTQERETFQPSDFYKNGNNVGGGSSNVSVENPTERLSVATEKRGAADKNLIPSTAPSSAFSRSKTPNATTRDRDGPTDRIPRSGPHFESAQRLGSYFNEDRNKPYHSTARRDHLRARGNKNAFDTPQGSFTENVNDVEQQGINASEYRRSRKKLVDTNDTSAILNHNMPTTEGDELSDKKQLSANKTTANYNRHELSQNQNSINSFSNNPSVDEFSLAERKRDSHSIERVGGSKSRSKIPTHSSSSTNINDDNEWLAKENLRFKKEIYTMKETINDLRTRNQAYQDDDHKRNLITAKKIERLEKLYQDMEKRSRELERDLISEKDNCDAAKRLLEDEKDANERNIKICEDNAKYIKKLEMENSDLRIAQKELASEVRTGNEELRRAESHKNDLKLDLESLNDKMKQANDEKTQVIENLKAELEHSNKTITELNSLIKNLNRTQETNKDVVDEMQIMQENDRKLIDNLKGEIDEERQNAETVKNQYENLKITYEDKLQAYNKMMIEKDERINDLENQLVSKQQVIQDGKSASDHFEKLYEEKKNEARNLSNVVNDLEASVHSKSQEIRGLKNRVDELEFKISQNKKHIDECEASRISPNSLNFNDTELSKEDQIMSMLNKKSMNNGVNHHANNQSTFGNVGSGINSTLGHQTNNNNQHYQNNDAIESFRNPTPGGSTQQNLNTPNHNSNNTPIQFIQNSFGKHQNQDILNRQSSQQHYPSNTSTTRSQTRLARESLDERPFNDENNTNTIHHNQHYDQNRSSSPLNSNNNFNDPNYYSAQNSYPRPRTSSIPDVSEQRRGSMFGGNVSEKRNSSIPPRPTDSPSLRRHNNNNASKYSSPERGESNSLNNTLNKGDFQVITEKASAYQSERPRNTRGGVYDKENYNNAAAGVIPPARLTNQNTSYNSTERNSVQNNGSIDHAKNAKLQMINDSAAKIMQLLNINEQNGNENGGNGGAPMNKSFNHDDENNAQLGGGNSSAFAMREQDSQQQMMQPLTDSKLFREMENRSEKFGTIPMNNKEISLNTPNKSENVHQNVFVGTGKFSELHTHGSERVDTPDLKGNRIMNTHEENQSFRNMRVDTPQLGGNVNSASKAQANLERNYQSEVPLTTGDGGRYLQNNYFLSNSAQKENQPRVSSSVKFEGFIPDNCAIEKVNDKINESSKLEDKSTGLDDLKTKLSDLQKNKMALEQRMHDFEKRLKESKKRSAQAKAKAVQ